MTPQTSQTADRGPEAELERLAYSAYLLTLDPHVALSVVSTAIDGLLEESTDDPNLLERTVELSLEQLRCPSVIGWDGEFLIFNAALYRHSAKIDSQAWQSLKDLSNNPILLLDSPSRVAFVLHHVLGYTIREAAAKTQVSEKEYRAQLGNAYIQLASCQLAHKSPLVRDIGDPAPA